jgi:hypothetical protein
MVAELVQHGDAVLAVLGFFIQPRLQALDQDSVVAAAFLRAASSASLALSSDSNGNPSHTPLHPLWLSRHSVAPARFSTCSSDWWLRMVFSL